MIQFVLQDGVTGRFLSRSEGWLPDLQKARVFGRACDAGNAFTANSGRGFDVRREKRIRKVTLTLIEDAS